MKKLSNISFLFLGLFSSLSFASPKELVCTSSAEEEANRLQAFAEENANNRYLSDESKLRDLEEVEMCRVASFGFKHRYVFDTDGLQDESKNKAEFHREKCAMSSPYDVVEVTLSATPNVISFTRSDGYRFNIDRKTLKGGWDTKRNFSCELKDIDVSDNLI